MTDSGCTVDVDKLLAEVVGVVDMECGTVRLKSDRINLGAWTAITAHRGLANSPPGVGPWRAATDDARH